MPFEIQIYEVQLSFFQLSFNNKRKPERSALCEDFIERTSRPHELVNPETLEVSANSTPTLCRTLTVEVNPESLSFDLQELSNIHELYAKMKTAVTASSEQAVSSIDLIRKNLVPELHGTVMDFYKWQQSGVGHFWRERLNIAFFFFCTFCVRCGFDEMPCLVRMPLMTTVRTTVVKDRRHSRRSVQLSRCSCSSAYHSVVLEK